MRRTAVALACAAAVALVPAATAAGPSISYTIVSGTAGQNGWYVSDVAVTLQAQNVTNSTCPVARTFTSSGDTLECTATDGTSTITFRLQFKIDKDKPSVTGAATDRAAKAAGW